MAGLITFKNLNSLTERTVVSQTTATTYVGDDVSVAELTEVLDALLALDVWPASYDGGPESAAALKNVTSELIGRFCIAAQDATLAAHPRPLTRYAADLIVPRQQRLECALLKGITAHYVMTRAGVIAAQARERELLAELAFAVERGAPGTLDPLLRPAWYAAADRHGAPPRRHRPDRQSHRHVGYCRHHRLCGPGASRIKRRRGSRRMPTFVIAGASLAGAKAAETLRDEGFDGQIVLLGAELERPYERPPLSKGYLLGNDELDSVYVHPVAWYAEHDIDLRMGVTVTGIDRAASAVIASDGSTVHYDKLLLSTGASPRRLELPRFRPGRGALPAHHGGLGPAARRLPGGPAGRGGRGRLDRPGDHRRRPLLRLPGHRARAPAWRAAGTELGPELGAVFAGLHRSHGVDFRFGEAGGRVPPRHGHHLRGRRSTRRRARRRDRRGTERGLAAAAGLEVDNGVLTDEALRTSDGTSSPPAMWRTRSTRCSAARSASSTGPTP